MLTADRAREALAYDPESGRFVWRETYGPRRAGEEAGRVVGNGYRRIWLDGREYAAHRIAFLLMTGAWPEGDVDHADMNRDNNRWGNLRLCSRSLNMSNTRAKRGIKGISWDRTNRKWRASITVQYRSVNLGRFVCLGQAMQAYRQASRDHAGEMARFS